MSRQATHGETWKRNTRATRERAIFAKGKTREQLKKAHDGRYMTPNFTHFELLKEF